MFKTPTKAQMKHNIGKLIGVQESDICCGRNKHIVNCVIQYQNSIELSCAEDYAKLNQKKDFAIRNN